MIKPIDKLLTWYFSKNALPYWGILILDFCIMMLAGVLTYWLFIFRRMDGLDQFMLLKTLFMYAIPTFFGAKMFHTYSGIVRYSSFVDLTRVFYANAVSLCIAYLMHYMVLYYPGKEFYHLPFRHIILMYIIATLFMWGLRVLVKTLYEVTTLDSRAIRVLIYGAMETGAALAKGIRTQSPARFNVKGFIAAEPNSNHSRIMGLRVFNATDDIAQIIKRYRIEAILVAPQRIKEFRNAQQLQDEILNTGVKIFMSQTVKEINVKDGKLEEGSPDNFQMKEVSVEDLLPRDEIRVDMKSVGELLSDKRILITGSAGSIGSELVRQIAVYKPGALMLIDQAETPEHDLQLMMAKDFAGIPTETIVTSICKKDRMEHIFSEFRPDYVFHAAAYKHVPMMEENPSEAVQNNVYGTKIIADLSVKYGVKKFVMVSTDKAVNPTNVMGCSKRICEIYVQALGKTSTTQFVTTRFGNVLGSNGSVIPLFKEQIKNGGPVTVTDERIVRYFMLIPEACKLVLEAGTKGNGGEIFVFDMGKPVRIADLAKRMIRLSGAHNVEIKYTGLRPGEKLYEEMLNDLEGTKPTFHEKIRIAEVRNYDYAEVEKDIAELIEISTHYDNMATVKKMKDIVPEYKSNNSVYEVLDQ
ncbi:NDP-sugar epimerase, includes UDP-GlcNAc-inverting 4,6-dehydratase FlaA1 and capsular polysaccharide biosynthesis protein EpsC [Prevotellaceae bacterium HUN156]|nr:NDP-sugar epimerase, includes UDP-GlcNAc-inverting 4,6-dehydratase FlaA1 and capsular polysaccharide biosynthesis protein EpsC [Prevotellaceae bacterium HUN156]